MFFFLAGAPYPAILRVNKALAKFFPSIFGLFQIFGGENVYEPNFAHFLGDFQLDILLSVLMNLQKQKIVVILGGDRS